jgi:S1-C subfamily serine protease
MKHLISPAILAVSTFLFASCTSAIYKDMYPTLIDGRYDSEFPYRGCSKQLEEVSETVKRITVMAHYKSYSFPRSDSVKISDITTDFLNQLEPIAAYQHYTTAGTGTVIYCEDNRIALVTCAHVVDYSDTVVTRYLGPDYRVTPYIHTIAIKTNQIVFLNEVAGGTSLETLALDRIADLAVIGERLPERQNQLIKVFQYPLGRAKQLEWGSFVYVFGYPSGYRMITKGIVSLSSRPSQPSFVVDAVVSPGSSGSIALAIRDGVPNFELVGIIKMIPAQVSYILAPGREADIEYDPLEPYHGEVFVQRKSEIQQGIAVAIPTETVISFLSANQRQLSRRGYDISSWLNPPQPPAKK